MYKFNRTILLLAFMGLAAWVAWLDNAQSTAVLTYAGGVLTGYIAAKGKGNG